MYVFSHNCKVEVIPFRQEGFGEQGKKGSFISFAHKTLA